MTRDERTCNAINTIRKNAGNTLETCPTCCRAKAAPYTRVAEGKIVEGCIDAAHYDHVQIPSNYGAWFNRPVAKDFRAQILKSLRAL